MNDISNDHSNEALITIGYLIDEIQKQLALESQEVVNVSPENKIANQNQEKSENLS